MPGVQEPCQPAAGRRLPHPTEEATFPDALLTRRTKPPKSPTHNRSFIFWAYPVHNENAYQEYYDLAVHLITKYAGSGKAFYVGHWEGDWSIRNNYK
jgi:hypothetical protein